MLLSLALRGFNKKKHREQWEQGTLMIPQADFKMQAVSQRWRAAAAEGEVWNDQVVPVNRCRDTPREQGQEADSSGRGGLILAAIEDAPEAAKEVTRANIHGTMQLKDIKCPTCHTERKVEGMKLRVSTGFSQLKCKRPSCSEVSLSST